MMANDPHGSWTDGGDFRTKRAPEVSVIIPCLNEALNAALYEETLFTPLAAAPFDSEVIFSDGGSSDGTPEIIERLSARKTEVRVLRSENNTCFAESIARALAVSKGEYIVLFEADLSFAPGDISKLLAAAKAGNYDCVCGSPFLGSFEGLGFTREALTRFANLLLRLRFDGSVTSYTQIFKLFRADSLRTLDFESKGFSLDAELLAKCLSRGFRINEVPVIMKGRELGDSKLNVVPEILNCLGLILKGVR
ncbi:MAG: hypothetical protein A2X28_02960 [Elusimicrobia bacterium GWA2_56_46]|nr:MAG: hypothetical protein A2X28_02960 [Elusimicrobia bacterium GWA2_56_46]OGR54189.1 MAG: hypothetical protein A2X39_08905 [Elusimicrobia bacterium GWC2_56_31]HBB68256.1 hypothetical protein [Elusimicrobiota bacterium]HBW21766.1 hypothetical protein [Elusimicrobiota bacterium]